MTALPPPALIEHARRVAHARGLSRHTLTTFLEVPWNGPWYQRHGFAVLEPAALPPWLAAVLAAEVPSGPALTRVAMAIAAIA